jgi:hypothetical protein
VVPKAPESAASKQKYITPRIVKNGKKCKLLLVLELAISGLYV